MKRRRAHGVSLVEMLLALSIAAIVMVPLAPLLGTRAAASAIAADRIRIERDADFALERIAARVRATPAALLAPQADTTSSGSWFSPVTFQLSGGKLLENSATGSRVLAESVTAFSITAPTVVTGQQLVQVSLGLARGSASTTHGAKVRMGGQR